MHFEKKISTISQMCKILLLSFVMHSIHAHIYTLIFNGNIFVNTIDVRLMCMSSHAYPLPASCLDVCECIKLKVQ